MAAITAPWLGFNYRGWRHRQKKTVFLCFGVFGRRAPARVGDPTHSAHRSVPGCLPCRLQAFRGTVCIEEVSFTLNLLSLTCMQLGPSLKAFSSSGAHDLASLGA